MSIGFLIGVLVLAVCTLCALRPLRGHGALGTATYLVGMVYNELPTLAVIVALTPIVFGVAQGDLTASQALIRLGVLAPVLAGLVWLVVRAVRSADVPEQALSTALGPGWRSEISPSLSQGLRRRVPWTKVLLVPFLRRRWDVQRIANLRYGDGGRRHRLDVYRHRSHPVHCPVLIHFHGGRFVSGAKNRESLSLLYRLAGQGWLCISANYRLQPRAGFPDYVVDAKRVLAWVRTQGLEYGADPATVFVAGNSAGGYLAAFAALTPNQPEYQPGFADVDTSVTAAIGLYGYYGRTEGDRPESSPHAHVGDHAPPILLVHGDNDSEVPVEWARDFADDLASASANPVVYTELPGAQHTFDYFDSVRGRLLVDQVEAFAAWVRSRPAPRPVPPLPSGDGHEERDVAVPRPGQ